MTKEHTEDFMITLKKQSRNAIASILVAAVVGICSTVFMNWRENIRTQEWREDVNTRLTIIEQEVRVLNNTKMSTASFTVMWTEMVSRLKSIDDKLFELAKNK